MSALPFELAEAGGAKFASNGTQTLQLTEPDGRVFRRRAIKHIGGGEAIPIEWAVAEIAGIRVYFDGSNVVVSRQEMNP